LSCLQLPDAPGARLHIDGGRIMAKAARKSAATRKRTRKTATGRKARKTSARGASRRPARKWSGRVTATSDALDLKQDVFKQNSPAAIARSLKRSAERSHRRKSDPYRSAMSMLVFYINRAGKNLSATRKRKLEAAKGELRKAFGRA
jgi:DMSO/TMAO reductase YedYZ molybdopterin-dependent catalytic subunit